jgi:hypothetical protein
VLGEGLRFVYPRAGSISMYLASDYIHPYKDTGGPAAYGSTSPTTCTTRL